MCYSRYLKILFLGLFLSFLLVFDVGAFSYRRSVVLSSGVALSDIQVSFVLNTASLVSAGKMRSDCGDLRVTDSDGATFLPYWIEEGTCNTSSTRVWVRVPSVPSGSKVLYVYYGNSGVQSAASGDSVFLFF